MNGYRSTNVKVPFRAFKSEINTSLQTQNTANTNNGHHTADIALHSDWAIIGLHRTFWAMVLASTVLITMGVR